jgi:hypothetical protein
MTAQEQINSNNTRILELELQLAKAENAKLTGTAMPVVVAAPPKKRATRVKKIPLVVPTAKPKLVGKHVTSQVYTDTKGRMRVVISDDRVREVSSKGKDYSAMLDLYPHQFALLLQLATDPQLQMVVKNTLTNFESVTLPV